MKEQNSIEQVAIIGGLIVIVVACLFLTFNMLIETI